MDTRSWGPHGWFFLHTITFNYPEKNPSKEIQSKYRQLFNNLEFTLPCKYCRESYKKFIKELPIDDYLGNRAKLTKWLFKIHNKVNKKLRDQGEPIPPDPSFAFVCEKYERIRASCGGPKKTCRRTKREPKNSGRKKDNSSGRK